MIEIPDICREFAKGIIKASAVQCTAISVAYLSQGEPINIQKLIQCAKAECLATPLCGLVIVSLLKRAKGPLAVFIAKRMIFGVIVIYIYTFVYQLLTTKNPLKALIFDHYNIQVVYKKGWLYWNAATLISDHVAPEKYVSYIDPAFLFVSVLTSTLEDIKAAKRKKALDENERKDNNGRNLLVQ